MKKMLLVVMLFSVMTCAMASEQSIMLSKYYRASCDDYTGTWQGFVTDPTDLIGNGGPWPITVSLHQENGHLWGRTTAFNGKGEKAMFKPNEIWARCTDGKLSDIFWGKLTSCGGLSTVGTIVSKNVLVMQLNWENAMTGANLLLFLQRKNKLSPYYEPTHVQAFDPAKVESCH